MLPGQKFAHPVMTIMDFFHDERSTTAGHSDKAPRLEQGLWDNMIQTLKDISKVARIYGIRVVYHPHAGGYVEFEDEIERLCNDISYDDMGLVLDTGHIYYAGGDPSAVLRRYKERVDYIHFKDVNRAVYDEVMKVDMDFFEAAAKGVMCPIGAGSLDYQDIRKTLDEIEYSGWVTIEQEKDPIYVSTSLEDVRSSYEFVSKLG